MEEKNQNDREGESALEKSVESRITAGPISNIISPNFVQREGFAVIYGCSEKLDNERYKKYFELELDNGDYYDDIGVFIDNDSKLPNEEELLNKGLKEDDFYLAHYHPLIPPDDRKGYCIVGFADLYSDKEISVDETGRFKEVFARK
jgi:hypothetical protein